jgi:23S rRNA pseudouridine2605 synthase
MPRAEAPEGERLQKVLSRLGLASRREAEQWIRAGRLTINGRTAGLGDRLHPDDQLRIDGRTVRQAPAPVRGYPVLLCHRSPGQPLLKAEGEAEPLVARLPARLGRRFVSVSPMPLSGGGLELVSSDGTMVARLQRAVRALPVEFSLRVRGELTGPQLEAIRAGQLDRGAALEVQSLDAQGGAGSNQWYQLVLRGASGNEVHQLLERSGVSVSRLLRIRLGTLQLERGLSRGQWRELTEEELESLLGPQAPVSEPAGSPGSGP